MGERTAKSPEPEFDEQGFLKMMAGLDPVVVEKLAEEIRIGPLTAEHWKVIDFVKSYYREHGVGPPVVRIAWGASSFSNRPAAQSPASAL